MNAVMSCIGVKIAGARHLALDNRYQCPELAAMLLAKCNMYSTGTVRRNRKGWDKSIMNIGERSARGTYKLCADKINRVLALQWADSKVVNVVTSYCDTAIGTVERRMGQDRKKVPCPCSMMRYQTTMFGVNKGDQMRVQGGGFASKAHFKKWYKKQFLAILDCMLLNSLVAWNLACEERSRLNDKMQLKRFQFMSSVAQSMLDFPDEDSKLPGTTKHLPPLTSGSKRRHDLLDHLPIQCNKRRACTVCKLEVTSMNRDLGMGGVKIGAIHSPFTFATQGP
jgi:Transposase IS4